MPLASDICRLTSDYGADRSRTDDLLNANQALSQLSYGPDFRCQGSGIRDQKGMLSLIPDPCLLTSAWWAWVDSNYRPHAYQARALTN